MGGRGSSSGGGGGYGGLGGSGTGFGTMSPSGVTPGMGGVGMQQATNAAQVIQNAQNIALSNVANQAPDPNNTPITVNGVQVLQGMSDDELATLVNTSKNIDMPNHLSDVKDKTQSFVYAAGLNAKPTVLDDSAYYQYLRDNNIPRSQQLARQTGGANYTVNGVNIRLSSQQCTALIKDGNLNYIGGKHGGQCYGAGTYFEMNGGTRTGYGSGQTSTCIGVLSPQAKVITEGSLRSKARSFAQSHPKFARAIGSYSIYDNASVYALAMGYNVISSGHGTGHYYNIIDRSALVMRASDL